MAQNFADYETMCIIFIVFQLYPVRGDLLPAEKSEHSLDECQAKNGIRRNTTTDGLSLRLQFPAGKANRRSFH